MNMEAIITFDLKKGISKKGLLSLNDETLLQNFYDKTKCNVAIITKNNDVSKYNIKPPLKNRLHIVLTRETKKYKEITEQIKYVLFNHDGNISENILLFPKKYNDIYDILNKFLQLFFPIRYEISKNYIPLCKTIWVAENKEDSNCDLTFDYQLENMFNEEKVFENNKYKIYKYTKQ
uniref:Uncharacterized protein n=1 Tax=viral metagenome TaxID=1070528 RepID=A0A6C0DGP7_9ZZZZ